MQDEKLMILYKTGDQDAFVKIYEKYAPMVYGFLRKKLPSSEVEDAYQNVWRHLHEKREHYTNQPFAPWFFFMIRNLIIDQYRSMGRRSDYLKQMARDQENQNSNDHSDIESLLAQLPQESRELVQKYYLDGFSYEELEKETGVSQTGLRKRLSRAIAQLRKRPEV